MNVRTACFFAFFVGLALPIGGFPSYDVSASPIGNLVFDDEKKETAPIPDGCLLGDVNL